MLGTKIEWATDSLNFWWGCTKVSPACAHCYAEGIAKIFARDRTTWGPAGKRWLRFDAAMRDLLKIIRRARRTGERPRVFVNSMSDTFEANDVLNVTRCLALVLMAETREVDFLLLTKRPENVRGMVPPEWLRPRGWPAHVWLGTTVENNAEATKRIPTLLDVPAAVRFLSCEPLLGPVDLAYALFNGADSFGTMPGIHWVIAGGESGGGARSAHPEWARSLRDQCRAANVPFFFKQWGEWAPMGQTAHEGFKRLHDFGDGQFMERVGKAAAGRKLDGLEWSEMPGMTAAERLAAVSPQLAPRRT